MSSFLSASSNEGVAIVTALSTVCSSTSLPFVSFCCLACAEVSTKTRVSFKCQFVTISPTIKGLIIGYRNFYLSFDLKRHKDYLMHIEYTGIIFLR